jgi:hypothetical protein
LSPQSEGSLGITTVRYATQGAAANSSKGDAKDGPNMPAAMVRPVATEEVTKGLHFTSFLLKQAAVPNAIKKSCVLQATSN